METSLRIVLILVAGFITLGIIWDIFLSRRKPRFPKNKTKFSQNNLNHAAAMPNKRKDSSKDFLYQNPFDSEASPSQAFEDVILYNPVTNTEAETSDTMEKIQGVFGKDLVVLTVMARKPGVFQGRKLKEAFKEANLFYGDMHIFHRHENVDGSGEPIFSVAQAVEPGIFDYPIMESFVTPGITLFFKIERPNQAIAAFELMLRTAKQLAMRLDGEIKDDIQKYLTLPTIEKYRNRMRLGSLSQ